MSEFGGPLGEKNQQIVKKQSRLETEIERVKIEKNWKGEAHAEDGRETAVVVSRKRDAKAEEKWVEKEAGPKSSSSSSPLKELNH